MNLNHLLYFRILAQTENYTEAAKRLLISQPSLTYAMKKLEGDIGVPLFEKTGRNVQLTEYGRELQKTTEEAYRQLTQTTNQMRMRCQQELTTLKIGIIPTLASDFIPEVIRRGKETGVLTEEISLFHGFTSDILKQLEEGTYDIGICSKQASDQMTFIPIKKQPFVLLVNSNFVEQKESIDEDWFNWPLVTYRGTSPIGKKVREVIQTYTNTPTIIEEFDDETSIGGYVSINSCVAVVAKTSLLKQFDLLTIPLDEQNAVHTVYLAFPKKSDKKKAILNFQNWIRTFGDF